MAPRLSLSSAHVRQRCNSEPDRSLYLAVPLNTYDEFFTLQFIQKVVQRQQLKLLLYDEQKTVISQWIN
ncbi:element excision factor XisH family protein [Phormidesmis priestleyi]